MSDILEKFKICSKISEKVKLKVKVFHIFNGDVLYVTNEDEVFGYGKNENGKCGFGHDRSVDKPEIIPELCAKNIKQFVSGFNFVLALNRNNQVFSWGRNDFGQLARGYISEINEYLKPQLISSLENITHISCGSSHCLALNADGIVYGWGNNKYGQVGSGRGDTTLVSTPLEIKKLTRNWILSTFRVNSIHCYETLSFAITNEDSIYSWGCNQWYQLGHESNDNFFEPKLINKLTHITTVCCNNSGHLNSSYFLSAEGNIHFCGQIRSGQCQKSPKILERSLKFQSLCSIDYQYWKTLALADNCVYYLREKSFLMTEYKTFLDFFVNECQITYKTIDLESQDMKFYYRFQELSQLGSGGFGTVFKVLDKADRKFYAMKKIANKGHDLGEKIYREVKILSECSECYVVKYFGCFIVNNCFYIKMELLSNNLNDIIKEKSECFGRRQSDPMTFVEYFVTSQISKELLESVKYLHELQPNPIIHRDLKPENILVNQSSPDGRFLKICDFGLATFDSHQSSGFHTANLGTIKYVAPEVLQRDEFAIYSKRSDIYSLSVILSDLFSFDVNKQYSDKSITNNEELIGKWIELKSLLTRMMNTLYKERPTCAQILADYNQWAIDGKTVIKDKSEELMLTLIEMKEFKNQFFYNYLTHVLSEYNLDFS